MFCLKLAKVMLVVRTLEFKNVQNTVFFVFYNYKTCKEHIKYRYEIKNGLYVYEIIEQTKSYLSTKPL